MTRQGGEVRRHALIEEAIRAFGREGYSGASLDQIATAVGIRKQTLLYYFPTKDALLEACLQAAGQRVAQEIADALEGKTTYWDRAEAVIHAVFGLAEEWPEFPMFVREAGRLGAEGFERFASVIDPLRKRAVDFLQSGMDAGEIREQDPALLLFMLYTAVVGSLTEASVLNAVVGKDKSQASLRRREREVVAFVRSALQPSVAPERAVPALPLGRLVDAPTAGDALQVALADVGEREAGTRRQVLDRGGGEDLGGLRGAGDPRPDDDGDPAGLAVDRLDLAGMHARTDLDAERPDGVDRGEGASDGTCRAVERGEEAVARGVHLGPARTREEVHG